ncbi:ribonuclease H-like domain, reverse transcriptase, RNA-dependent DNA polymerase [Tanacetum coccineum]
MSMNYKPIVAGNQTNGNAGIKENIDAGQDGKKIVPDQKYILLPLLTSDPSLSKSSKDSPDAGFKPSGEEEKIDPKHQENEDKNNVVDENIVYGCIDDPNMPNLEEIVYSDDDEEVGAEVDMNNLATNVPVSPILTTRVHKDHPLEQIIGDIHSAPQTRRMTKNVTEHVEPKKVIQALTDLSWIKAMQDELLQFKLQKVCTLVDLPHGKRAISTKWVYRNKKDDRGILVRNKEILVAQGYTQEEGIDYDEVFALVARIEAISQDKYVDEILKKFGFSTMKTASTPMETSKPLLKDENAKDVDVYLYRSMIGSLMYLTSSRPDIMFAVCTCARFQVTPKVSHLHVMKRIFRYLKGQPKLGLWYPKDLPFVLEAYTNSDYAGASCSIHDIITQARDDGLSAITELVYFIKPHDHLNPVFVSECNCPWRVYDCVVMLELKSSGLPSRFGEV